MFALLRTLVRILFFGHLAKNRMASPHKMICSKHLWAFQRWTDVFCRNSDVVKIRKRSYLSRLNLTRRWYVTFRTESVQNPFEDERTQMSQKSDSPLHADLTLVFAWDARGWLIWELLSVHSLGNSQLTGFCVRGNSGRVKSNLFQQQTISFDNKRISFVKKPRRQIFLWPFL